MRFGLILFFFFLVNGWCLVDGCWIIWARAGQRGFKFGFGGIDIDTNTMVSIIWVEL